MNRLAAETSPCLAQHADDPVDWYPGGEEAFAWARDENKPILLPLGYAACRWCHVMEHESFEDEETARLMNGAPARRSLATSGQGTDAASSSPDIGRLGRSPITCSERRRAARA